MKQKTTVTETEKMNSFTDMAGTVNRAPNSYANYVTARRAVAQMEEAVSENGARNAVKWGDLPRVMFVPRESDGRIVVVVLVDHYPGIKLDHPTVPTSFYLSRGFLVVG